MLYNQLHRLLRFRKKINSIDSVIISLLKERSFIIPKVKKIKENWNYKIAFKREVEIANKIAKADFGLYNNTYMQKMWRELISATLTLECNLTVSIYRHSQNYFHLWELAKDQFGVASNLYLKDTYEELFDDLINHKTDCLILPFFTESDKPWWLQLLDTKYKDIKINLVLPHIAGFKTLGNYKAVCLSLNNKDIFSDNLYYICEKEIETVLDKNTSGNLIQSPLTLQQLMEKYNLSNEIQFIGSAANSIREE